jgi:hypothetical protein
MRCHQAGVPVSAYRPPFQTKNRLAGRLALPGEQTHSTRAIPRENRLGGSLALPGLHSGG